MQFLFICLCLSICLVRSSLPIETPKKVNFSESNLGFTGDVSVKDKIFVRYFELLPAELKKIVLEYLSPTELFEFIQNDYFIAYQDLAAEAFGNAYGNSHTISYSLSKSHDIIVENGEIHFANFTTFTTFLSLFNRRIKKLQIDNASFRGNEFHQALNIIAENCASTLTTVEIRHIFRNELTLIKEIRFPNVRELFIFNSNVKDQVIDLSDAFPNVRRLIATLTKFADRNWIERHYTNLTHLQVQIEYEYFTELEVVRILEANPGIRTLSIVYCPPSLLRTINERFPNIVNLGIVELGCHFSSMPGAIHLNHVERYSFDGAVLYRNPHFITFDKLKELRWRTRTEPTKVLDIIQKHRDHLEGVYIENSAILDEHLALMVNLAKLERISFCFNKIRMTTFVEKRMSAEGLMKFIRSNENLSEIQLLDATQELRQELYATFNSSGVKGSLFAFDPYSSERGNVFLNVREKWNKISQHPMALHQDLMFLKDYYLQAQ